ncbi:hypothetical protein GCM10020331_033530 [Ectobacillus funiculus]
MFGPHRIYTKQKQIEFTDTITWHVSSVLEDLIQQLREHFLMSETVQLNGQTLYINKVEVRKTSMQEGCYKN